MGQLSSGPGGPVLKQNMYVKLCNGLSLSIDGTYKPAEPEVGISTSFEVIQMGIQEGSLYDFMEWTEAQHGGALVKLEELCIEYVNNE